MSRFFVTLNHPNGGVVPLMDDDQVVTFNTYKEAKEAVHDNMLGRAYGGIIYDTDRDGEEVD